MELEDTACCLWPVNARQPYVEQDQISVELWQQPQRMFA
jgi:hypothetical protein